MNFSFNGSNEVATIVPATNRVGIVVITITVSDGVTNVSQASAATVTAPTPPTLGAINNQTTSENTPVNVTLSVTSPVTPLANLTFTGSSTNTNLVKSISFSFNGTNEVATITPVANASGVGTVTISVNDAFSTNSQTFSVLVNSAVAPTMSIGLASGVLTIAFAGTPGATYNLQSSTDLINWTTIAAITANPTTGAAQYQTTPANVKGGVFYRLEIQ